MITEDGKVVFEEVEQKEIDRIVGERLAREKSKFADYDDVKGILEELKEFGYEGDPKSVREAIRQQKEEIRKQAELAELQEQARQDGTSPELIAEIKALKAELTEIKGERNAVKQAEAQRKAAEDLFAQQVAHFREADETKDVDLEKLGANPKFVKFLERQKPTGKPDFLVEAYKDYVDLVGGAEAEAAAKIQANLERSTASGRNKGDGTGGTYGLSEAQISTVDEWNKKNPHMKMSYKEFAERMK